MEIPDAFTTNKRIRRGHNVSPLWRIGLTNIFKNFVPNKLVTFNYKDAPPIDVRNKIKRKTKICYSSVKNARTLNDCRKLQVVINLVLDVVKKEKMIAIGI